jgi:NO-binding membrane sensor protein with MHYT domain
MISGWSPLAALVCLLACFTAFSLIAHGRNAASQRSRWLWITGAAIVTGSGVWATHFVAMLAYQPGLPLGYDVAMTIRSVVLAIAISWAGCVITLLAAWRTATRTPGR